MKMECYEEEVQSYRETDYKSMIYSLSNSVLCELWCSFSGYNKVVTIPSGASDITIQQRSNDHKKDDNYLGQ